MHAPPLFCPASQKPEESVNQAYKSLAEHLGQSSKESDSTHEIRSATIHSVPPSLHANPTTQSTSPSLLQRGTVTVELSPNPCPTTLDNTSNSPSTPSNKAPTYVPANQPIPTPFVQVENISPTPISNQTTAYATPTPTTTQYNTNTTSNIDTTTSSNNDGSNGSSNNNINTSQHRPVAINNDDSNTDNHGFFIAAEPSTAETTPPQVQATPPHVQTTPHQVQTTPNCQMDALFQRSTAAPPASTTAPPTSTSTSSSSTRLEDKLRQLTAEMYSSESHDQSGTSSSHNHQPQYQEQEQYREQLPSVHMTSRATEAPVKQQTEEYRSYTYTPNGKPFLAPNNVNNNISNSNYNNKKDNNDNDKDFNKPTADSRSPEVIGNDSAQDKVSWVKFDLFTGYDILTHYYDTL